MKSVKCYCNICGKLCDEATGKSFIVQVTGAFVKADREEGDIHLCLSCQTLLPKVLPNPEASEATNKFEECRGVLAWVAQAIGVSPEPPKDESEWHTWLCKIVPENIHNKLRRGNWSTEIVADVLMALDEAEAPTADSIFDRILALGSKANSAISTHKQYLEAMSKVLDSTRRRHEDGSPSQSDFGEVRDIIQQMQKLRQQVLRLQGVDV